MDIIPVLEEKLAHTTEIQERIDLLNALGFQLGRRDAQRMYETACEAYQLSTSGQFAEQPYLNGQVASIVNQARYLRNKGKLTEAQTLLMEGLEIAQNHPESLTLHSKARLFGVLGTVYQIQGDYTQALHYKLQELDHCERLGDKRELGIALGMFALFYDELDELEKAKEFHQRSLALVHETEDYMDEASFRSNYARLLVRLGSYEESIQEGSSALELSRQLDFKPNIPWSLLAVGIGYFGLADYATALDYLQQASATQLAYASDDTLLQFAISGALIEAYLATDQDQQAFILLQEHVVLAAEYHSIDDECVAHKHFVKLYKRQGNATKALEHFERFYELQKQINGQEADKRRKVVEARYQIEASKREAELQRQKALDLQSDIQRRQIVEEALRNAKEAAEEASRIKSDFLANMSHEIRTPLNGVIGMTELLLDSALNAEQREFAQIAHLSGETLLTLINDILDFSKIESGKLELELRPFDLHDCVESVLGLLSATADAKGVTLVGKLSPNLPIGVLGDETRLHQILVNLVNNAIKFTEKGEVELTITLRNAPVENSLASMPLLHFTVRDTGIGIPADKIARLFQLFVQGDASMTRRYGGTGLGLAICKRLVGLMAGQIWVESKVGEGSSFHFTLPLQPAALPAKSYHSSDQPLLRNKRVLVLEPQPLVQQWLQETLAFWGMNVVLVATVGEALEEIAQHGTPDALLVDIHLQTVQEQPILSLFAQAQQAHRLAVLTSIRSLDTARQLAVPYLIKPLKPAQLLQTLQTLCDGKSAKEPNSSAEASRPNPKLPIIDSHMAQYCPLRILIAEDNTVNQKVVVRMLERIGYQATLAETGVEVLAALRQQPYDLILMDMQMPDMDGLTATRMIQQEWSPLIRPTIVALTANALPGDRERYLENGLDDYLGKPIRLNDLIELLRSVHSKRQSRT